MSSKPEQKLAQKLALRKKLLEERGRIPKSVRDEAAEKIFREAVKLPAYTLADKLLIYVSNENELSTRRLLSYALDTGREVYCPRCVPGGNDMVFRRVRSLSDLKKGSFGLLEPDVTCEAGSFTDQSLCVTPALAFDRRGYRIGYGRGYYDKFFCTFPGIKLGLCYEGFLLDDVFRDGFDVPVDVIMTEKKLVYPDK